MTEPLQQVIRWEPLEGIPDATCADFKLTSNEDRSLDLILRYSWIIGNPLDLHIHIPEVLAFRTFDDADGPSLNEEGALPKDQLGFKRALLEITNSDWYRSADFSWSRTISETVEHKRWQHFSIVTLERRCDILGRGTVIAKWKEPAA